VSKGSRINVNFAVLERAMGRSYPTLVANLGGHPAACKAGPGGSSYLMFQQPFEALLRR